jgi:hypothetical protein
LVQFQYVFPLSNNRKWNVYMDRNRPCHSSGSWLPASHNSGLCSSPGKVMWDLWWTKWHWRQVFFEYCSSPAKHSTDCSTLVIIHYHPGLVQLASSGLSSNGLNYTPLQKENGKLIEIGVTGEGTSIFLYMVRGRTWILFFN